MLASVHRLVCGSVTQADFGTFSESDEGDDAHGDEVNLRPAHRAGCHVSSAPFSVAVRRILRSRWQPARLPIAHAILLLPSGSRHARHLLPCIPLLRSHVCSVPLHSVHAHMVLPSRLPDMCSVRSVHRRAAPQATAAPLLSGRLHQNPCGSHRPSSWRPCPLSLSCTRR
jgi:hypothetical protein